MNITNKIPVSSLNYDFKSENCVNLKSYFSLDDINDFLNGEKNFLKLNLDYKFNLYYKIIYSSDNLKSVFLNFEKLKIRISKDLEKWIKNNYKFFKNSQNHLEWWNKNFDFKKFYEKEALFFLIQQIKNYQNKNFNGSNTLHIYSNFVSFTDSQNNNINSPLFSFACSIVTDKDKNIIIKKHEKRGSVINQDLILKWKSKISAKSLEGFNANTTYQNLLNLFVLENNLVKNESFYENNDFKMDLNFFFSREETILNNKIIEIELSDDPINIRKNLNLELKDKRELIQTESLTFEKNFFQNEDLKSKIIFFNSLAWINKIFLKKLFFNNLSKNIKTFFYSYSYSLIKDFLNEENNLNDWIFFNYNNQDSELFFNKLEKIKKLIFLQKIKNNSETDFFSEKENQFLDEGILKRIDNYKTIYNLKSENKQNLDFSLTVMDLHNREDSWSKWSKIAFKYTQIYKLKLKSLINKVKIINELNNEYYSFINKYGYKDFWNNISKHKKFLIDYDEKSVLRVLYYLWIYIDTKEFPARVSFFTLNDSKYSQEKLTDFYKLFHKVCDEELFYIEEDEIKILLNNDLERKDEYLSLINEKWLFNNFEFKNFLIDKIYNQLNKEVNSKKIFEDNVYSLGKDYLINFQLKMKNWDYAKKDLFDEMFLSIDKYKKTSQVSLFIDKYHEILIEIFPIFIWYDNLDYLFNKFLSNKKFDKNYWWFEEENFSKISAILKSQEQNIIFSNWFKFELNEKTLNLLKIYDWSSYQIEFNINQLNKKISKITNNKTNLIINHNIDVEKIYFKNIYINKPVWYKNINLSLIDETIQYLKNNINENSKEKKLVIVKDNLSKIIFLKKILSDQNLVKEIKDQKLIINNYQKRINFFVDETILVLNDNINFFNQIELIKLFYNQHDFHQNIKNILRWTKKSVITFANFQGKDISYVKNKENSKLLKMIFEKESLILDNRINNKEFNLIKYIYSQIVKWLDNIINFDLYDIKFDSKNFHEPILKIIDNKNKVRLLIRVIHNNKNLSFEENFDWSIFLRKKGYPTIDVISYDWFFKKAAIKKYIEELLEEKELISLPIIE